MIVSVNVPIVPTRRTVRIGPVLLQRSLAFAIALTVTACSAGAPPTSNVATPPSPPAPAATEQIASPSPTPTPQPAAAEVPFPDVPLLAATSAGEIQSFRDRQWVLEGKICPSGQASFSGAVVGFNVSADGSRAWYRCDPGGAPGHVVKAYIYDRRTKSSREIQGTTEYGLGPLSPDGRYGVLPLPGIYEAGAPISQNKRVLVDLQTDSHREILPSDYWWIEMKWTEFGLTYYRPQFGPNHNVQDPNKRGTFRWDGNAWQRISGDRLVEVAPDGSMVLERRNHLDPVPENDRVVVIERVGTTERELTPPGVSEFALGADARGVTAFRPDGRDDTNGSFIRYENGQQVSALRGRFSPYFLVRTGDWVVSGEYSTSANMTLFAYSLTQRTLAAARSGIPVVALSALKP